MNALNMMNKTTKIIAACALVTGSMTIFNANSAWAAIPIQHWTQASGAQVYLVESPALPMVDVQIDFDAGERYDPATQAGLASVTAGMLDKGVKASGNQSAMDENQLGEAWADLGAAFGAGASNDRFSVSLRSLTDAKLLDKAVDLAARQMGEPSFPAAVWQRDRERIAASLKEARTRPGTIAGLAFTQAVYGSHPYGYETTEATLNAISAETMRAWHARMLLPCRAKLSIVGAVTRAQADRVAQALLAKLPAAAANCGALPANPPVPDVAALKAPKVERIAFDSAQAHVLIGQPGYKRDDPRHFALMVGNHILGTGFTSRLVSEVREKRGLSYSVYSGFSPGLSAGAFVIGLQTKPEQADQAVKLSKDVLSQYVAQGPSQAELKAAKDNLIGGFALLIDSNKKLVGNVANIAWNGLPLDYLDNWSSKVNAVTTKDVRDAFQSVLQPDRMVTVTVGAKP